MPAPPLPDAQVTKTSVALEWVRRSVDPLAQVEEEGGVPEVVNCLYTRHEKAERLAGHLGLACGVRFFLSCCGGRGG